MRTKPRQIIIIMLIISSAFLILFFGLIAKAEQSSVVLGVIAPKTYKVIAIANQDGTCQDLPNYLYDPDKAWNMVSETQFCNQVEQVRKGCCSIRGRYQILKKEKYECTSLCKESGQCNCDLDFITCDPMGHGWYWWKKSSVCPETYPIMIYKG